MFAECRGGANSPDLVVAARELTVAGAFREISRCVVDVSDEVAVPSTETPVCARDRTNSTLHIVLPERNDKPAVTYAASTPVVECN